MILDERGKKYILKPGSEFQSDLGIIKAEILDNAEIGDELETHMGKKYRVISPNINDYIDLMKRRCAILLPQDLGLVVGFTGIGYKSKVVESGSGAGSSLLFFANIVGPEGHVSSYEIREDFVEVIKENIEGTEFDNITLYHQDVTEGFKEEDESVDLVFLDLPRPGEVIEDAYRILKMGGFIAIYTPFVEQFQIASKILRKHGFKQIKIREGNVREMEYKDNRIRPNSRMAGHTGYITFARKI